MGDPASQMSDGFHLAGLGELILGLGELFVGPLRFVVEPAVLEGDRSLRGKGGGDDQVLGAEPLRPARENGEDAHDALSDLDGHGKHGSVAASRTALSMCHRHPQIVREVRHEERLAAHGDPPGEALSELEPGGDQDFLGVAPRSGQHELLAFHAPEPDRFRVEKPAARFGYRGEQRFHRLDLGELAAHLEERLQVVLMSLQGLPHLGIANRDGGLVGKQRDELPFFRGERPRLAEEDGQHPHGLLVGNQGKAGKAAEPGHRGKAPVPQLGIIADIQYVVRRPRLGDASGQTLAIRDDRDLGHDLLDLGIEAEAALGAKHAGHRIRHGDASARGAEQGSGRPRHRLTDLGGALGRGHQPRERAERLQLVRARLGFPVETGILESDGRLSREGGGDRHVLRREALRAQGANAQRSQHLLADLEGHTEKRAIAAAQVGHAAGRGDSRIVRGVRQEERLARGDDGAGQTLADLDLRVGHGCLGIAPDALEHEIIAIHHSDAHRVRVEERPARLGHLPQQILQGKDPRELTADLEQRLEPRR